MTVAIVTFSALVAAAGAVLVTMAATGAPLPARTRSASQHRALWWRLALGVVVALALWAVTSWPVAGAWIGTLAFWLPSLAAKGRQRKEEMAVASAVARLAGMMRDQVLVGADVAEAIRGCAAMAPTAIAPAVAEMAERLRAEDPDKVLADFAAGVNDPMAELLAVSLRFALTRRTAKLAALFDEVARATEEQVRTRRSIEKDRRRLRTAMWSVITAVTVWLVVIYLLSGSYLVPYNAPQGQAVIALAGAAFAVGLVGMAKMDNIGGAKHLHLQVSEGS